MCACVASASASAAFSALSGVDWYKNPNQLPLKTLKKGDELKLNIMANHAINIEFILNGDELFEYKGNKITVQKLLKYSTFITLNKLNKSFYTMAKCLNKNEIKQFKICCAFFSWCSLGVPVAAFSVADILEFVLRLLSIIFKFDVDYDTINDLSFNLSKFKLLSINLAEQIAHLFKFGFIFGESGINLNTFKDDLNNLFNFNSSYFGYCLTERAEKVELKKIDYETKINKYDYMPIYTNLNEYILNCDNEFNFNSFIFILSASAFRLSNNQFIIVSNENKLNILMKFYDYQHNLNRLHYNARELKKLMEETQTTPNNVKLFSPALIPFNPILLNKLPNETKSNFIYIQTDLNKFEPYLINFILSNLEKIIDSKPIQLKINNKLTLKQIQKILCLWCKFEDNKFNESQINQTFINIISNIIFNNNLLNNLFNDLITYLIINNKFYISHLWIYSHIIYETIFNFTHKKEGFYMIKTKLRNEPIWTQIKIKKYHIQDYSTILTMKNIIINNHSIYIPNLIKDFTRNNLFNLIFSALACGVADSSKVGLQILSYEGWPIFLPCLTFFPGVGESFGHYLEYNKLYQKKYQNFEFFTFFNNSYIKQPTKQQIEQLKIMDGKAWQMLQNGFLN